MARLLEAGATGILYPRVEAAAEAKECVRWAKFAPLGERGFDGGNADASYGSMDMASYVKISNRETFILAQIESSTAVPHARAIAEVEGIDGLFFGPGDFSVLAGVPGQFDSDVIQSAIREVSAAAKRRQTVRDRRFWSGSRPAHAGVGGDIYFHELRHPHAY